MASPINGFYLTPAECQPVNGCLQDDNSVPNSPSLCLIGKLLTDQPFNLHALRNTIKLAWKLPHAFTLREIHTNLLAFQFTCIQDKNFILSEGPWSFDRHLLVLKHPGNIQPSKILFTFEWFWVRVQDLPLTAFTTQTTTALGSLFLNSQVFTKDQLLQSSGFLRLRVDVDLLQPLRRGALLTLNSSTKVWVKFQYEKSPNFCYACGILGHIQQECSDQEAKEFENQYGNWLRAPPLSQVTSSASDAQHNSADYSSKETYRGARRLLQSILSQLDGDEEADIVSHPVIVPSEIEALTHKVNYSLTTAPKISNSVVPDSIQGNSSTVNPEANNDNSPDNTQLNIISEQNVCIKDHGSLAQKGK